MGVPEPGRLSQPSTTSNAKHRFLALPLGRRAADGRTCVRSSKTEQAGHVTRRHCRTGETPCSAGPATPPGPLYSRRETRRQAA